MFFWVIIKLQKLCWRKIFPQCDATSMLHCRGGIRHMMPGVLQMWHLGFSLKSYIFVLLNTRIWLFMVWESKFSAGVVCLLLSSRNSTGALENLLLLLLRLARWPALQRVDDGDHCVHWSLARSVVQESFCNLPKTCASTQPSLRGLQTIPWTWFGLCSDMHCQLWI